MSSITLLLAGYTKHCMESGGMVVDSESLAPEDVAARLQAVIDSIRHVSEARGAFRAALDHEERAFRDSADLVTAVRQMAMTAFKSRADTLADFGLERRERKQRSVEEKRATVEKLLATLAARDANLR